MEFFIKSCVEDWWNWIDIPTLVLLGQTTSAFDNSYSGEYYNFILLACFGNQSAMSE